jgi:hypothetical protein
MVPGAGTLLNVGTVLLGSVIGSRSAIDCRSGPATS